MRTKSQTLIRQSYFSALDLSDSNEVERLLHIYPDYLDIYCKLASDLNNAISDNRPELVRLLLAKHSEVLKHDGWMAPTMHDAAQAGMNSILMVLLELGVNVNIPRNSIVPVRPISTAANLNHTATVKLLLEKGSEINYEWGGFSPTCSALTAAIINDNLEMAQMLVEAGGFLNVVDRTNRTPLTWALEYGRADIAEYLRSKGAQEARYCEGYRQPEKKSPIVEWIERKTCPTSPLAWVPIIPNSVPVAVRALEYEGHTCLFTDGMSSRAMNVPPGREAYRFAELILRMPGFPHGREAMKEPENVWAINWLQQLAQYPFEHNTWLGAPVTVVDNGNQPRPLGEGTTMTGWLLCADKPPFARATLADGKDVAFYTLLPLHAAECAYERQHGPRALLELFAERNVPEYWDPKRPSAV